MADTVKLDEERTAQLEELRARVERQTGTKITQRELLSRLIESALKDPSALIDSFGDNTAALSEDEIEQFNQGMFDSGVETDEDDIDDILYE